MTELYEFVVRVEIDNEAFHGNNLDHEVSRLLLDVAKKCEEDSLVTRLKESWDNEGHGESNLLDINGNACGEAEVWSFDIDERYQV